MEESTTKIENGEKKTVGLKEIFGIDIRSLALFRIALALLIIFDLYFRIPDIEVFYTDEGVFPRAFAFYTFISHPFGISIHHMSGNYTVQLILFFISFVLALLMLIGFRTRLVTFLSWLMLISLHMRNEFLLTGGDFVLRLMMFWSLFLPLGAFYSVDSALNQNKENKPTHILSIGTLAVLMQSCFIYWFSVCWKLKTPEWVNGTAVYYAFSEEHYAKPFAISMLNLPMEYLKFLNEFIILAEIIAPILFFSPLWFGPLRTIMLFSLVLLQTLFMISFEVGFFPWSNCAALIPFIPSCWWEKIFSGFSTKERTNLKIYYDPRNNISEKLALILKTFLLLPESKAIPHEETKNTNEIIIEDHNGDKHAGMNAFNLIFKHAPLLSPISSILNFLNVGDCLSYLYKSILNSAKLSLFFSNALVIRPLNLKISRFNNIIAAFFLLYVTFWNYGQWDPKYMVPDKYKWIATSLVIDQAWAMFTPISRAGYWFIVPGKLKDGTTVDLFKDGGKVSWEKPKVPSSIYKDRYWASYIINIYALGRNAAHLPYYGNYLCKTWNRSHGDEKKLTELKMYMFIETTAPQGEKSPVTKRLIWKQQCN